MRSLRSLLLAAAALLLPVPLAGQLQPLSEVFPVAWPVWYPARFYGEGPYATLPGLPLAVALGHGFAVASLSSTTLHDAAVDGSLVDLSGQPGPGFLGEFVSNDSDAILDQAALAATGSGGFVLVWPVLPWRVLYRRFGPGGTPLSQDDSLNLTDHKWSLLHPAVAGHAAGGFAAAWEGCLTPEGSPSLCARAFDPAGQPATAELRPFVPGDPGIPAQPRVGLDATGRFVVLWRQEDTASGRARLCGQSYGARGGFLGAPFCIGDLAGTTGGALATDPAGAFLAAWFGPPAAGAPAPLFVRRYHLNGTPLAEPVQVAAATDPADLTASADGKGNAALSWHEGDRLRVLLVRRDGVARGPAITVSGAVRDPEIYANGVALADSGRLLVTWKSGDTILGQLWRARF